MGRNVRFVAKQKENRREDTHVSPRCPSEADIGTTLNDGITRRAQINIHILAIMHAELTARDYDDAILNTGDMGGTMNLAADQ